MFIDNNHKDFFIRNVEKTNSQKDSERKALFYVLGLTDITRACINDLYDFGEGRGRICIEGLRKSWQTGTTMRLTRLAFNLYNGYCGEDFDQAAKYTPYNIFDSGLAPYMLEAIRIRYADYCVNSLF